MTHKLVPIEQLNRLLHQDIGDIKSDIRAMLETAPDVGGEAVMWASKLAVIWKCVGNGICTVSYQPRDEYTEPLFTYQPDAAKRIAQLEADKARLVEALKDAVFLIAEAECYPQANKIFLQIIAEMEGKV